MPSKTGVPTLGQMVREYRLAAGLTQHEVAARTGLKKRTISRIENDVTHRLDFQTFARVCAAIDLPLKDVQAAMREPAAAQH